MLLPINTSIGRRGDLTVWFQILRTLVMATRYLQSLSAARPCAPTTKAMKATKIRRHGNPQAVVERPGERIVTGTPRTFAMASAFPVLREKLPPLPLP